MVPLVSILCLVNMAVNFTVYFVTDLTTPLVVAVIDGLGFMGARYRNPHYMILYVSLNASMIVARSIEFVYIFLENHIILYVLPFLALYQFIVSMYVLRFIKSLSQPHICNLKEIEYIQLV